ncbi:hypothetical protein [Roseinatronobacter alkalisoli]|uniref:EamA-like transporter family protein n=1 Tax=Roseinatronobacter alkalisoli TaxID=3028235 RepID=A0ABT5T4A9_9RHOB|nr:hypothetical protein [Roseinatronobacter sp. HJB301]MDD7969955.1 hypothetical protein [Roseinatronobacter sp. HJB301]
MLLALAIVWGGSFFFNEIAVREVPVFSVVVARVALAAISHGFAGIYGRRFRKMGISPMCTATGQVVASSVILLPVMVSVAQIGAAKA